MFKENSCHYDVSIDYNESIYHMTINIDNTVLVEYSDANDNTYNLEQKADVRIFESVPVTNARELLSLLKAKNIYVPIDNSESHAFFQQVPDEPITIDYFDDFDLYELLELFKEQLFLKKKSTKELTLKQIIDAWKVA
jgi:hypothetical protein